MLKPKQVHKSKEQIIYEKQEAKHKAVMGKFIEEHLMPFLEGNTQNLEEAQFLTESLKVAIAQAWEMQKRELKLSMLKMKESLAKVKKPEAVAKHVRLIEILEDQTIDDCLRLLDAVYDEANRVVIQQLKEKSLSDFKDNGRPNPTSTADNARPVTT